MSFFTAGLVKRGSTYYIRVRVPDDLRRFITNREIKQSLRTARYCEAVKLARAWRAALDNFFSDLRRAQLTDTEILQLRDKYLHETTESNQRALAAEQFSEEHVDEVIGQYQRFIEIDQKALKTHDYSLIEKAVERFFDRHSITIDKDSNDYPFICQEFLKARITAFDTKLDRARGNFTLTPTSILAPIPSPVAEPSPTPASSQSAELLPNSDFSAQLSEIAGFVKSHRGSGGMMSEVVDKYIARQDTEDAWTDGTEDAMRESFDLFKDILGDRDVLEYDSQDFDKFKMILSKIPKNRNKNPKFRKKTIPELLLIPLGPKENLAPDTQKKHCQRISQLFSWAEVRKIIGFDYSTGITKKNNRSRREARIPYAIKDLQKIIRLIKAKRAIPTQFWIPLLGLYTGMRADEICQLYLDDIYSIGGILCIDSTARRPDQNLKTPESSRTIPIHPFLLELGFMTYHKETMEAGHERLWPKLIMRKQKVKKPNGSTQTITDSDDPLRGKGGYGAGWCNWYNEHFNRKHITDDPKKVFHSFRHNLPNLLTLIPDVKSSTVNMIMGHVGATETERTYLEKNIKLMYAALEQAQYPIDLDILREKSLWNKEAAVATHVMFNPKTKVRPAGKAPTRRKSVIRTGAAAKSRK